MAAEATQGTISVKRAASFSRKNLRMTAGEAIKRLAENDARLTTCDLSNSAVLQMKANELMPKLGEALANNTVCTELNLASCGIDDASCEHLGTALQRNSTLTLLNLEGNKVHNDGAIALANGLAVNKGLLTLNLLNQTGARYGDQTLQAYLNMFDTNVTLLKIVWRLESRKSFSLTKMLTRNNDIDRRIKAGKEYAELLPEGVVYQGAPLTASKSDENSDAVAPRTSGRKSATTPAQAKVEAIKRELELLDAEHVEAIAALEAEFDKKVEQLKAESEATAAPAPEMHKKWSNPLFFSEVAARPRTAAHEELERRDSGLGISKFMPHVQVEGYEQLMPHHFLVAQNN
ncbi:hypothetical protein AB1Y20_022650 [Prymnesium parvum]|uniref:Uncharacterized protein n=1 Tax=Prymnesium parvum TaxID=97485 RepID=A0AB34JI78_PRYPA